ncbi:MAG TPA: response regulator [Methanoregula sp.]|nr:response regulator [Methanoregula sp.]
MAGVVWVLIAAGDTAGAGDLARQAEAEGYRVKGHASSGKEAVKLAETHHPDIVLADTKLRGGMSIQAVVKKIQVSCSIPVVIVADSDDDVPALRRNAAFPFGCLVRPFGTRQFRQVIDAAVFRHISEPVQGGTGSIQVSPDSTVDRIAHDINNSLSSALANIQISRRSCIQNDILCGHLDSAEASVLRARDQSRQLFKSSEFLETVTFTNGGAEAEIKTPQPVAAKKKEAGARYRILLMDDEPAILSATSEMLSFLGHDVTVAENGDSAIDLYRHAQAGPAPYDAVILDITVPGGKGAADTLPAIRALDPEVRAIISSGYATHPLVVSFAQNGFMAALVKPYGFKELEESLYRAFQS